MTYTPVGWANDETHVLSQANMKTLDQGIKDAHLLDVAEVTSGTALVLELTVPTGATAVRVTGVMRSNASGTSVGSRISLNAVDSPGAFQQVRHRYSGSATPTVSFPSADDHFGTDTVVPAAGASADAFGQLDMLIPNVRDAGGEVRVMWRASMIERTSAAASVVTHGDVAVAGAKPVTAIYLTLGDGSFVAGSRFELRIA